MVCPSLESSPVLLLRVLPKSQVGMSELSSLGECWELVQSDKSEIIEYYVLKKVENQEVVDVFAGLKEPDHIIKVDMGLESTFPLFLVHWGESERGR